MGNLENNLSGCFVKGIAFILYVLKSNSEHDWKTYKMSRNEVTILHSVKRKQCIKEIIWKFIASLEDSKSNT